MSRHSSNHCRLTRSVELARRPLNSCKSAESRRSDSYAKSPQRSSPTGSAKAESGSGALQMGSKKHQSKNGLSANPSASSRHLNETSRTKESEVKQWKHLLER